VRSFAAEESEEQLADTFGTTAVMNMKEERKRIFFTLDSSFNLNEWVESDVAFFFRQLSLKKTSKHQHNKEELNREGDEREDLWTDQRVPIRLEENISLQRSDKGQLRALAPQRRVSPQKWEHSDSAACTYAPSENRLEYHCFLCGIVQLCPSCKLQIRLNGLTRHNNRNNIPFHRLVAGHGSKDLPETVGQ
jgi:hypothetical protein